MPLLRPDEIRMKFQMLPPELQQGVTPNDTQAMQAAIDKAQMQAAISNDPNSPATQWKNQLQDTADNVQELQRGNVEGIMANRKVFNLRKSAQAAFPQATPTDMFGAESSPEGYAAEQQYTQTNPMEQQGNQNVYNNHTELDQELSQYQNLGQLEQTNNELALAISGNEAANGALERYYSEPPQSENRVNYAEMIYQALPENMKSQQSNTTNSPDGMSVPVNYEKVSMADYLNAITASIKDVADQYGKNRAKTQKKAKGFNLKKTAQHQTGGNVIMWGPGQTRPDPFLRGQPVSDWHILERNKGFGGDIDGYWGVDWEAVWRGNVMDKFSRPYRDTTTGEWVGGYIQKRFEIDKNIPETNNYQLLPGERRKPYIAEHKSTEARLQAMRNKNDGHLGRVFNDTSKPFNWREASKAGKIKTASLPKLLDENRGPVLTTTDEVDAQAQLDVTTEKQLANVAQRPGVFGLPSIQRHNQPEPAIDESSEYKNNYGDGLAQASAPKKKTNANAHSSVKTAWLNEGRPQENPLDKPLTLPGEKAPKANFDTEHFCPRCGSQISSGMSLDGPMASQPNKCPNCHYQINDRSETDTGKATKLAPDAPKPDVPTPGTNVKLNSVLFDSRTGKFIIAKSELPDPGFVERREWRKKFFPDKKDLPRADENLDGQEFKQLVDPSASSTPRPSKVDMVNKSCTDLAIDG